VEGYFVGDEEENDRNVRWYARAEAGGSRTSIEF